jgi:hypothetical protein
MITRYLHYVKVDRPVATETAAEARGRLAEKFPRNALRRMTHLGMLIGSSLEGVALLPDDAVVYASKYAETRALEDFLSSFPSASPLLFQTSIHPGAVQQVLIGRQQPIARLWPMTGGAQLVEQALQTALLEPAPRTCVLGGEERGTWLLEKNVASDCAFAFALLLTRETDGALGEISWDAAASAQGGAPSLIEFAEALAGKHALRWHGWALSWR